MTRVYVMLGVDASEELVEDVLEAIAVAEEELGVEARLILVPGSKVVTVNGFLASSGDEVLVRVAEVLALNSNVESLVLACCS